MTIFKINSGFLLPQGGRGRQLILQLFLLHVIIPGSYSQENITIRINAGNYQRDNTPVWVHLPKPISDRNSYVLTDRQSKLKIPAQLVDSNTVVFILRKLNKNSSRIYTLSSIKTLKAKNKISVDRNPDGLLVKVSGKPLLFYHITESMPPADSPSYYRRSGFIHPLYTPEGKILTDDFPVGHIHQHAIFMAWVNITFRKEFVDFWNQHLQKGTVEHAEVLKIKEGLVLTELKLRLRHKSLKYGEVLKEIWTIDIYSFSNYFLFDLFSEQVNTTADTLFLNSYHYGGLAFRGSRKWNSDDKKYFQNKWQILTSEGIKDTMANQTHARWVDASGKIDGEFNGVTIFNHPSNFRYPQPIRVHPEMPYWAYAPVIDGPFTLNPGIPYRSQFRYYVHTGNPDTTMIEKIRRDWVEPPEVKVIMK